MDEYSQYALASIIRHMKESKNTVVLTGAGISTSSGIPDFRSSLGTYSKYPSDVFSVETFYKKPDLFYKAFNDKFRCIYQAKPNVAHHLLKKWEDAGFVHYTITQNVDGLDVVKNLIQYHGNVHKFSIVDEMGIQYDYLAEELMDANGNIKYRQKFCEKEYIVKPDMVLFGEMPHETEKAITIASRADFFLVIGTSLSVYPFNALTNYATSRTMVGVINGERPSYINDTFLPVIGDISEIMEQIDSML